VLLRLDKIEGLDLRRFDFDYDLTWMGFFLNADETVYARYGGRDAKGAEGRMSLAGLRYTMQAALETHKNPPKPSQLNPDEKPLLAQGYLAAKGHRGCIHCHQIWEFRRADAKTLGTYKREDLWIYPLPDNVGLVLEKDRGNIVQTVPPGSPAAQLGILPGAVVQSLNGLSVSSFGDAQYALHRAPAKGTIPIAWQQAGKAHTGQLQLAEGWRKTNVTWRPSMLDILPSLSLFGDDLTDQEKKALGLAPARLAFRQDKTVQKDAAKLGVQGGDVIIGCNGETLEMTMLEFLGYIRKNFLVGDKITLNVLRNGKRIDLPGQL